MVYEKLAPISLNEYVDYSKSIDSLEYINLIKEIIEQIKKEQSGKEGITVFGRLLYLTEPWDITIIGDIHGDLQSLVQILHDTKFLKSKKTYIAFLGDYGDRGLDSSEVIALILMLKKNYPERVILLRGNHEGPLRLLPSPHDLPLQLTKKYGENGASILKELRVLFDYFYYAVVIKEKAVLIHGGFPSKANTLEEIAYAFSESSGSTHVEEMLWNDPVDSLKFSKLLNRGIGKYFGEEITERFLELLNVKILIRGHEFCYEGFKFNHNGKVLTLFSTIGAHYDNKQAAYLQLKAKEIFENATELEKSIRTIKRHKS